MVTWLLTPGVGRAPDPPTGPEPGREAVEIHSGLLAARGPGHGPGRRIDERSVALDGGFGFGIRLSTRTRAGSIPHGDVCDGGQSESSRPSEMSSRDGSSRLRVLYDAHLPQMH